MAKPQVRHANDIIQRAPERQPSGPVQCWRKVKLQNIDGVTVVGQFIPIGDLPAAYDWPADEILALSEKLLLLSQIAADTYDNMQEHDMVRIILPKMQSDAIESVMTLETVLCDILQIAYDAGEPCEESIPVADNLNGFIGAMAASRSAE